MNATNLINYTSLMTQFTNDSASVLMQNSCAKWCENVHIVLQINHLKTIMAIITLGVLLINVAHQLRQDEGIVKKLKNATFYTDPVKGKARLEKTIEFMHGLGVKLIILVLLYLLYSVLFGYLKPPVDSISLIPPPPY